MKHMGKMVAVLLAVLAGMLLQRPGLAAGLSFHADGKAVTILSADDLARKFPLVTMQVQNPENGQRITYEGYRFAEVLTTVFGTDWPRYQTIEFDCADGYRPRMKADMASRHQGLIAVRESGKATLPPLRRADGSTVDVGAFYVVWENIRDANAATNKELSWPWQLVAISVATQ